MKNKSNSEIILSVFIGIVVYRLIVSGFSMVETVFGTNVAWIGFMCTVLLILIILVKDDLKNE